MTQAKVIAEALKRVIVNENPEQDAAASIRVDYSGGGDVAHLTINPDLMTPEALEGYRVRAAIQAALEPLRRYNRAMTRRYGTYADEQQLFDDGIEQLATELEQLVHLTPTVSAAPALAPAETAQPAGDQAFPDDFPEAELLRAEKLTTYGAVRDASDATILAISGIGPKKLEHIRSAVQAHFYPDVSQVAPDPGGAADPAPTENPSSTPSAAPSDAPPAPAYGEPVVTDGNFTSDADASGGADVAGTGGSETSSPDTSF